MSSDCWSLWLKEASQKSNLDFKVLLFPLVTQLMVFCSHKRDKEYDTFLHETPVKTERPHVLWRSLIIPSVLIEASLFLRSGPACNY